MEKKENAKKNRLKIFVYCIGGAIAVLCCILLQNVFSDRSKADEAARSDTNNTIQSIKTESIIAGNKFTVGQRHLQNADTAITGADKLINSSQEAAGDQQAGIRKLQGIIDKCKRINDENGKIIQQIDGSTGAGAEDS